MTRKRVLLLLLLPICGALYYFIDGRNSEPELELEEGFSYLVKDSSLQGWSVVGGEATYELVDGEVVGRRGPGKNTFLRTDKTYGDFILKMQMRWDELGNSGVMLRGKQHDGDGKVYGYQYELDPSERAWSGGIYDESRRGWIASLENNEAARQAIRLDDWNDLTIEARGANIKTWVNGVATAEITDGLDADGFIALQVHSGKTGVIRWRNIRVKELDSMSHSGEGLEESTDWLSDGVSEYAVSKTTINGVFQNKLTRLTSRRQLDDIIMKMEVPACEEATRIRLRQIPDEGRGSSFVELSVYAQSAEVRLVIDGVEAESKSTTLDAAATHQLTLVTLGDAVTLTVDGQDVFRALNTGLDPRGQFVIEPARCNDRFSITDINWTELGKKADKTLFYQTLDNEPAPVLEPADALKSFRVAPGFEVELVAAEPLVEDPVAMAWDAYGRLYVVELRGYMPDAYGVGRNEPVGQVVRLEDVDGDGKMDTSEVFLGQLVNPRAVAVVNGGILIAEPPHLWFCELPTKEALCENKRSVGDYASDVETSSVEHLENGLLQGLDNWLYNSKSARRHKLVNGELQVGESFFRGQWGLTKDDYGRLLYNHNSTWIQADLFAAEDIVQLGRSEDIAGLGINLTEPSDVFSVRVNPGVNRAYLDGTLKEDGRLNKATGVSGLVAYRGDQFPQNYRGDIFVPEVAANVVAQFSLVEEGMELSAKQHLYDDEQWGQREFLGSTDERFRPVDAMNGPDGALYIIDMYRGIIQDQHFLTDELREQIFQRELDTPLGRGRIWRVRHIGGKSQRSFPQLAEADGAERVAALSHANGWVRDTAQRLLLADTEKLRPALKNMSLGDDTIAAIHAIWTLQGRGELDRNLVLEIVAIKDPKRQFQALRAGRDLLAVKDLLSMAEAMHEAPEALRMQLAFVMGDHAQLKTIRGALQNILHGAIDSEYVSQAVVRAVQVVELQFLQELFADSRIDERSEGAENVLAVVAVNAYKNLRGDLSSTEISNPLLQGLLLLVASRQDVNEWQQVAMLDGLSSASRADAFSPAMMASVPPIFSDGNIGEDSPLWLARLAGRRAFTWDGDELVLGITPLSPQQLQLMKKGELFYAQCSACHGVDGTGITGLAPALANSPWVTGAPEWLARIILQGMHGPVEIDGEIWNAVMPPHGHLKALNDETLAGLMIYLRRAWGNTGEPVSVELVREIRSESSDRAQPWTVTELESVAVDRGFGAFVGKYSLSFITITITEHQEGLHMSVPMYGSGILKQLSDTEFVAESGGNKAKLEFVVEPDGSVNSMLLHRGAETNTLTRKSD